MCNLHSKQFINLSPEKGYLGWWSRKTKEEKEELCREFCFTNREGNKYLHFDTLTELDLWRIYQNKLKLNLI